MMNTSINIFLYLCGIAIFGLIYKIFDYIINIFKLFTIDNSVTYLYNLVWSGALIIYLIAGIIYIVIDIKNWRYIHVR